MNPLVNSTDGAIVRRLTFAITAAESPLRIKKAAILPGAPVVLPGILLVMANTNPQIAKPRFLSDDAIFRAARRSTVQSAHLEERDVPEQFHRTTASEEYLTSRVTHYDGLDQHPPLSGSSLRETPQRFGMSPGYGATPLPFDELDALLPAARSSLDEPVMRADV